ncbi:hypothetical protein BGW80DRAFT_1454605 [Lactifluus volemus]|nr:hypothetical protein BGW80DRAFT_1454605 [Lactifluus volemus]
MDDGVEMKGGGSDTSWGGGSDPGGGALATSQRGVENLLTLESDASCEFRSSTSGSKKPLELPESDRKEYCPLHSGQSLHNSSLEAHERGDSVGLLSSPSSQPGSAAHSDLTHSRGTLRCNSHVSAASVSLAPSCTRAQSFTHSIGSASRSSIELLLGRTPSSPGASQRSPPPSPLGHSTNDDNPLELLNVVLVASVDGKFHALNCLTGAKLWSMPSSPPPSSAPHGSAAAQSVPSILEPLVSTKHLDFSTRWVGHLMWGNFAPASPDNWLCAMYFE